MVAPDHRRIVHVVEAFVGGVARHVTELVEGLPEWEHVVCLSLERHARMKAGAVQLERSGGRVRPIPMRRGISPRHDLAALQALVGVLRETAPAVVHGHSAKGGFLARAAARLTGLPAVYTPHGLPFHRYQPAREATAYRLLERLAGRWTAALVAVSEPEAVQAAEARLVPPQKISVIHNAARLPHGSHRAETRQQLGLPAEGPMILSVSHLRPQKAPLQWLQVAEIVAREAPDAHFLWAGDGEMEQEFLAQAGVSVARRRFHYLGYREDPGPLYDAADIFTLTSLWEGAPYALLDAMAHGLPCAVTEAASGGAIRHGMNGLVSPTGEPEALARSVIAFLRNPGMAHSLGHAAPEAIRRHYSPEEFAARHCRLYSQLKSRAG